MYTRTSLAILGYYTFSSFFKVMSIQKQPYSLYTLQRSGATSVGSRYTIQGLFFVLQYNNLPVCLLYLQQVASLLNTALFIKSLNSNSPVRQKWYVSLYYIDFTSSEFSIGTRPILAANEKVVQPTRRISRGCRLKTDITLSTQCVLDILFVKCFNLPQYPSLPNF